jgi:hypothetical protein
MSSKHEYPKRRLRQAQKMEHFSRIDQEDVFRMNCPAGTSATEVLMQFVNSAPEVVRAVRNWLVSIVGLKSSPHDSRHGKERFDAGRPAHHAAAKKQHHHH